MIFTKFLTGFLYDKFGIKFTMNLAYISAFVSMFLLMIIANTPFGAVIGFIRLPFAAIAIPLETVMLPLFASEMFGNKSFDKFVGLFVSASTAGFALGSPFGNICYDIFGSYKIAFFIFALLMLFVTVAMQFVVSAAEKDKKRILNDAETVR